MGSLEPLRSDLGDAPGGAADWSLKPPLAEPAGLVDRVAGRRLLFLDDDPSRASAFLGDHPEAIWVRTAAECIDRLSEIWDEVHLDHDLGGKTHVDMSDEDCGMEVIRWLCREFRPHLAQTTFLVHTHNLLASLFMVLQMRDGGYRAEFRPFGDDLASLLRNEEDDPVEQPRIVADSTPARVRIGFWRWFRRRGRP